MPGHYALTPSQAKQQSVNAWFNDADPDDYGISFSEIFSHKSPMAMLPIMLAVFTIIAQIYIWTRPALM